MIKQGKFNWKSDGTTSVDASLPAAITRNINESDEEFRLRVFENMATLKAPNVRISKIDLLTVNEIRVMSSLKSLSEIDDFPAPNLSVPTKTRRRGANDL